MKTTIRRLALENAIKYGGTATPKALVGQVIREHPEAKEDMHGTMQAIHAEVELVNELALDEQKAELIKINPNHEKQQQAKKEKRKEAGKSLPPLPNAEDGKVVTRIPPEPSKYAHLGHAMSFLINYLYAQMYHGKCILRFDDTNPDKATQEFADAIEGDVLEYMDIKPSKTIFASERMDAYYEYAQQLIDKEQAYCCSCEQSQMSLDRREMKDCPHRSHDKQTNQTLWDEMKAGKEGIVLRLKIDMQHKNAVMRDPAIYRVCTTPHYKQAEKYKAWPLYDFESAIEEANNGITHVMRSNEFQTRIELQHYIAELFDLPKVTFKQYGRVSITGTTTQGREIREGIENGTYTGWDDPRLVTLKALKRRGIVKESLYELAQSIGMSKNPTNIDYSVLAAINRRILDKSAKRLFMIDQAKEISINEVPESIKEFELAFHPENEKGERVLKASQSYLLEEKDFNAFKEGELIRLMDAFNFEKKGDKFFFVSESYEEYRDAKNKGSIIQFIPKGDELASKILMDDASTKEVFVESTASKLAEGEVVQFERWGFARLDKQGDKPSFWFSHA